MITDVELKTIEKRLDGIREGILRIRTILIVTIVTSSAIMFVLFNASLSRVRSYAMDNRDKVIKSEGTKTYAEMGTEVLLDDWYRSRNIQVDLLGISVNVTDLPVVGSITLIVITIWYFYSFRQSNRSIVETLQEFSAPSWVDINADKSEVIRLRRLIYTAITQTNIFTKNDTLRVKSGADVSLRPEREKTRGTRVRSAIHWLDRLRKAGKAKFTHWLDRRLLGESDRPKWLRPELDVEIENEPATFSDRLVKFMFYLPFWTSFAILFREVINLLSSSPVYSVWRPQLVSMIVERHYWSIALAILFTGFASLCTLYLLALCNGCLDLARASNESLWEFNNETDVMERVWRQTTISK